MDRILRVNVGAAGGPAAAVEGLGKYAGLGGRAMTSGVVCAEVPPDCHPLGPENKLVIAPGLVSGSMATTSGRISVGCKSPLTGGIKEANSGGTAAQAVAKLGYAAIILEGERADDKAWYMMILTESGASFERCDEWGGLGNYDLVDKVIARFGTDVSCISIGTAGAMRMANSTIAITDPEMRPTRHCGRGGVGAVMGSKGIKLIVVDSGAAKALKPADPEAFKTANRAFVDGLRKHPVSGQALPAYGTNVLTGILNEVGGYPTRNFSEGRFPEAASALSGEAMAELEKSRGGNPTHGCHRGCAIQCSGIFVDKDGKYVTKQPEYETVWAHGGNCGITDLDVIAILDRMDDDYGFDTIEMGATIAVAMEAGIVPFGDCQGAINLVREAGLGTPLGRVIGAGAAVTAKCYGLERAPVVKGQAMPAYDPRAVKGIGVTYATTPMGADHTAGYSICQNVLKVGGEADPLSPKGQAQISQALQIATAAVDATGFCLFTAFALLDQPETFQAMLDTVNAQLGLSLTADDVVNLGKSILRQEKEFNEKAGLTKVHDRLPRYMRREPVAPHGAVFDVSDEDLDSVLAF